MEHKIIIIIIGNDDHLTESDLPRLLSDDIVCMCLHWEDVGLELGLSKGDIEHIAAADDSKIQNEKHGVLYKWLIYCDNPTLEVLYEAIDTVIRRQERKENRDHATEELKKARKSVNLLEVSPNYLKEGIRAVLSDWENLVADLKSEQRWFLKVRKWNDENAKLQQGKITEHKINIQEVLGQKKGTFNQSLFVQDFLRNEGYRCFDIRDEVVEGFLRKALLEIDINQSKTIGPRFLEITIHYRRLRSLQAEIVESKELLEDYSSAYTTFLAGMQHMVVETDILENLEKQLNILQVAAVKCIETSQECDIIYQQEFSNFQFWKKEFDAFVESFSYNVKEMLRKEAEFEGALLSLPVKSIGAVFILLPGVGIIASRRAVDGVIHEQAGELANSQFQTYKEILENGKIFMEWLNKIVVYKFDIIER